MSPAMPPRCARPGNRRPEAGRRPRHVPGALPLRLSAGGPRAEAGLPGCLPQGLRGAGARDRRWRPGRAARPALARGRQALQRLCAARWRPDPVGALQGRPAELRRLRRERASSRPVRCPARWCSAAYPPRPADLRGHLERGGGRVPGRDRRRDPALAERLALSARRHRRAHERRGGARRRNRPAAGLSQPGRRPGRARLRRRLLRPQRRSRA